MLPEELKSLACCHLRAAWTQGYLQPAETDMSISHEDVQSGHYLPSLEQVRHAICVACPDLTLTIEEVIAVGEQVATWWTLHGTDTQGYQRRLPTGRQVTTTGMQMARFDNDQLVEVWETTDLLGLLSQLGFLCIPEPPRISVRRFCRDS
jgi:predicted ester cyclase